MLEYQQLATEKYLRRKLKKENREVRRVRNRKAIQDFTTFLMGVVAVPFAILLGQQIPHWLPIITDVLQSHGLLS